MNKKIIKLQIVLIVGFLFWCSCANASVVINEVQLNPTEERFIELYNSGTSAVDLTDWYIQRKTATGSDFGSLISKTNFEGKSIGAGGYFLISKGGLSNSDIIYSGLTLTESNTIQIKNGTGDIVDKVGWGDAVDCGEVCALAPIDNKSISKMSDGSWVVSDKTPRQTNSSIIITDGNNENTDNTIPTNPKTSNLSSPQKEPEFLKITTKIISPKIVTAGIPFSIGSLTTTNRNETYNVGKFVWNFGDGMMIEKNSFETFDYLYEYPGDYVLALSYFATYFSKTPETVDRVIIKVIPSEIFISGVGDYKDPYVEIGNKSSYEVDLSGWVLAANGHYFNFPEGMILLPNKTIKLSPKLTGFKKDDLNFITITNSNKEIIVTYPADIKKTIQKNYQSNNYNNSASQNNTLQTNITKEDSEVINLNNLGASAGNSDFNNSNQILPFVGLFVVIIIGATSFLLIKKKKDIPDYVEKEISAKDMKIIE